MVWTVLFILCQAMFVMSAAPVITYKTYRAPLNDKTWEEAKSACSASKSLLALLDSSEKISAVKDSLSNGPYWIGLKYRSADHEFVWSSGEVANKSFLGGLYNGNENSLVNSGKTCFLLQKGAKPFKKEKCDKKYGFICQTTGQEELLNTAVNNSTTNSTATVSEPSPVIEPSHVITTDEANATLVGSDATVKKRFAPNSENVSFSSTLDSLAIVSSQTPGSLGASYPTIQSLNPASLTLSASPLPFQAISASQTPSLTESIRSPTMESNSISNTAAQDLIGNKQKVYSANSDEKTYSANNVDHLLGSKMMTDTVGAMLSPISTPSINTASAENERLVTLVETVSEYESRALLAKKTTATVSASVVDMRGKMISAPPNNEASTTNEKPVTPVRTISQEASQTLAGPTTATTPTEQEQRTVREMLQRMEHLDVDDPVSINGATSIWGDCVEFLQRRKREGNESVSAFLCTRGLEDFAILYARHHLNSTSKNMWISNDKLTLRLTLVIKGDLGGVTFNEDGVYVHLPSKLFRDQDTIVYSVVYHDLHESLSNEDAGNAARRAWRTNTRIVGSAISPTEGHFLPENISLVFQHIKDMNMEKREKCAFWNFSISQWSTFGCSVVESNASSTVCTCNHLTNFAVLVQTRDTKVSRTDGRALELITYIGLGLSLLGEAITLASYFIAYSVVLSLREQQEQQLKIRRNLVASLALAQIMFLSGIGATEIEAICIIMAVMIHYFYLVAFCWMLVEGVFLYMMVVRVYHAEIKMIYCNCFAFGTPAVIVASTLCLTKLLFGEIENYVSSHVCWLSFDNYLIWSFIGPVVLIESINAVILFRVIKEMASMQRVQTAEMDTFRQSVKACVVLFPLLGITWLFGLLTLLDSGVAIQYIFTSLNSTQGFLIFIFHCLRNSQIRAACEKKLEKWLESKSYSAGGGGGGGGGRSSGNQISLGKARVQEHSSGIGGMIEMVKRNSKITPVDIPAKN